MTPRLRRFPLLSCFVLIVTLSVFTGCSTNSSPNNGGGPTGNTDVTLLATSSANDQLFGFQAQLQSLTLTNQAGTAVSFTPIPQNFIDYIHLNGETEPITTVSIPQGNYVSATATIGSAQFECAIDIPGTLDTSTFAYGQTPASQVAVSLPSPITVTGSAMGLSLAMQVSQSATWAECYSPSGGIIPYTITPTFNLTPVTFSNNPTNSSNGKLNNLAGIVNSVAAGGTPFTVTSADEQVLSFNTSATTTFQGITAASALVSGMAVSIDANIQADGTVVADRVSVPDTNTASLRLTSGPLIQVPSTTPILSIGSQEQQGALNAYIIGGQSFNFSASSFAISGAFTNLASLPFTPAFSAATMVAGQEVSVTSHDPTLVAPLNATTVTLMPQTINGTVTNISSSGNFTIYTVQLAAYDLFPDLAQQPVQKSILTTPNTVTVYADQNTQQLISGTLAVGAVARFNGVIFNDSGTLRMDCAEIATGVKE